MRTNNYSLELMVPLQNNKEIIFNESICVVDNFCSSSALSFINEPLGLPKAGLKYIIQNGTNKGSVCYCIDESKNWQFLKPFIGMIIFVQENNDFYIFENDEWKSLNLNANINESEIINNVPSLMAETEVFKSINNEFELTNDNEFIYLYLNGNCRMNLRILKMRKVTVILKQNFQTCYKLTWPANILWKGKIPHQMIDSPNSIDMVRLYRLPETSHFLGEIVNQNYNF